jgi:hypothetical protein
VDNKRQIEELVLKIKMLLDSLIGDSLVREHIEQSPTHEYAEKEMARRRVFTRSVRA